MPWLSLTFLLQLNDRYQAPEDKSRTYARGLDAQLACSAGVPAKRRGPRRFPRIHNTAGGTLLVGVEDRSRNVRGVPDALDVEERIANIVSDSISPRLLPEIEILPWRRTQVLAIQIHPSAARPHYLKREGAESGTYVRVGSTNRRADAEMLQELRRSARGETYDEQPMVDLDSEALDF